MPLAASARAVVRLHDQLIEEAATRDGAPPDDSYERWCAAIDELRAALDGSPREADGA